MDGPEPFCGIWPSTTSGSFESAQKLLAQIWPAVQFATDRHPVRQCWSGAHARPLSHGDVPEQGTSAGNWQMTESLVFTQLCPAGQSADVWQTSWHLPAVQTRVPVQSLLRTQVPPTSIFFAELLQLTTSQDETTIKPGMRNDADISILQVCFQRPEEPTGREYHSRLVGSCQRE
jgi:hypothetical protein